MIAPCPQVAIGSGIGKVVLPSSKCLSLTSKFSTLNMNFYIIGRTIKFTIEILTFLVNKIPSTAVSPIPHTQNVLVIS